MSECFDKLATRPILYTDTIKGEQTLRDDLWAVTTEELNEVAVLRVRRDQAEKNLADAKESANAHRDAQIKAEKERDEALNLLGSTARLRDAHLESAQAAEKSLSLAAERIKAIGRAARNLIDEAERVTEASREDGKFLVHLARAAADMTAALSQPSKGEAQPYWCGRCAKVVTDTRQSDARVCNKCDRFVSPPPPSLAPAPKPCEECGGSGEIQVECRNGDACSRKKEPHFMRCPKCAPSPKAGQEGA